MVRCWIEDTVAAKHQELCLLSIVKTIRRLSYNDIADMASMLINFNYQTSVVGNAGNETFRLEMWLS